MDPSGWANLNWRCCECLNGSVGCSIDCWIARDASACLWYRGVQVHGAQLHSYNVVCGTTRSINTYSNNNNKSVTRRVKFHVTVWRYYCNNYIAYTYSGSKLSSYNCRKYVDRMRSNRNIGAWTRAALESPKIDTDSHVRNTEFPFDYIVSTRLKLKEMMATI